MSCVHIKTEVKTEEEELQSKTRGFLCSICGEQLCFEKYFTEHIREHHCKSNLQTLGSDNSLLDKSTELSDNKTGNTTSEGGCCSQSDSDELVKTEVKTEQSEACGKTGGFLCPVCCEMFVAENTFMEHIKEHRNDSSKRKRTSGELHHHHVRTGVGEEPNSSNAVSENLNPLNLQKTNNSEKHSNRVDHPLKRGRVQTGVKPFKCADCPYAAAQKSVLINHLKTHTGVKPFKCLDCPYAAARKSHLKYHMATHTGEKLFKCPDCSYTSARKSDLHVHMKAHTEEKLFKCPDCSYAAAWKSDLHVHMKTHTGEKLFKCRDCSFATVHKSSLNVHLRTHTGERQFKCPDCPYAAARKWELKYHNMVTHTGERPFQCRNCSYTAVRKSDLHVHMKTHTVERPFKCLDCSYAAARKSQLKVHMKIHTVEK